MIFNQFEEFGNYLWHYEVTGHAMEEVLKKELRPGDKYRGVALTTGSAGTIACGDFLKQKYPESKIIASEALQCPTLLENGLVLTGSRVSEISTFPGSTMLRILISLWLLMITLWSISCGSLMNPGAKYLIKQGLPEELVSNLDLLGFSGIANLLSAIKFAKYYELDEERCCAYCSHRFNGIIREPYCRVAGTGGIFH